MKYQTSNVVAAHRRALAAMLASALFFACMGACIKAGTRAGSDLPAIPAAEIACIRYLLSLALLVLFARIRRIDLLGEDRLGLCWRGLFGGMAGTLFFVSIQLTLLTNATLLNYTAVVWGPLMAVYMLGEPLGRRGLHAVLLALWGVLLVTHPQMGHIRFGDAIALFSGLLAGAEVVWVRRLRRGESSYAIFFYLNLLGAPIAIAAMLLTHTPLIMPLPAHLPLLLAVGASSFAAQLLMTYGFKALTAMQGSLISLTTVVYIALFGRLLFQEPLKPTTIIGGAMILLSAVGMSVPTRQGIENGHAIIE